MGKSHQPKSYTYVCQHCGKEYHPKEKDRNKYCSRECAFADKAAKQKKRKKPVCVVCGKEFEGRPDQKHCSDECRKQKARSDYKNKYFISTKETNEYIAKTCKWCGRKYRTNYYAATSEYCSKKCARAKAKEEYKAKRKEQIKRAFIEPVHFNGIYKRDNGICQICGKPVKYSKDPADIMAATIDHIIPLSRGGLHCKSNCQLAHRICNSNKGDKLPEGYAV